MHAASDQLATLMQALARQHAWAYRPPERGRYAIVVGLGLEISLFQVDQEIFFEGWVAAVPSSRAEREETLRRLLQLQLARLARFDQVLILSSEPSLQGETQQLMLYQRLSVEGLRLDDFERALSRFVTALDLWGQVAAGSPRSPMPVVPHAGMLFP